MFHMEWWGPGEGQRQDEEAALGLRRIGVGGRGTSAHSSRALGPKPPSLDKPLWRQLRARGEARRATRCLHSSLGPGLPLAKPGDEPLGEKRGRRCLGMRAGPEQEASRNQGPPCTAGPTTLSREGQRGNDRFGGKGMMGGGDGPSLGGAGPAKTGRAGQPGHLRSISIKLRNRDCSLE